MADDSGLSQRFLNPLREPVVLWHESPLGVDRDSGLIHSVATHGGSRQ